MKKLLYSLTKKDFKIDYFSGSGAGGQHRNKHQNCVRIHHPASGALVTGQSHKSRRANVSQALNGLLKNIKFKLWHTRMINEVLTGKTIEERVEESMVAKNLKVEGKDSHERWATI